MKTLIDILLSYLRHQLALQTKKSTSQFTNVTSVKWKTRFFVTIDIRKRSSNSRMSNNHIIRRSLSQDERNQISESCLTNAPCSAKLPILGRVLIFSENYNSLQENATLKLLQRKCNEDKTINQDFHLFSRHANCDSKELKCKIYKSTRQSTRGGRVDVKEFLLDIIGFQT